MATLELHIAAEADIEVIEDDALDASNATIQITDADDLDVDMTSFAAVELVVYADDDTETEVYKFAYPADSSAEGTITRGDGYIVLVDPIFTLARDVYRYNLRELDTPESYGYGLFTVKRKY